MLLRRGEREAELVEAGRGASEFDSRARYNCINWVPKSGHFPKAVMARLAKFPIYSPTGRWFHSSPNKFGKIIRTCKLVYVEPMFLPV